MPTIRYCPWCEREHKFQMLFDEECKTFELWCHDSGILVERISKEEEPDRFLELRRRFWPPPEE